MLKSALPSVLLDCVRAVARGDFWIDNDGVHALARAVAIALAKTQPSAAARAETLTARQRTGLSAGIGLPKAGADDALHDRGDGEFAGVDTGVGRRVAYPSITAA